MISFFSKLKKYRIAIISVSWLIYSFIINSSGVCSYWIDEYEDGWYIMTSESDGDGGYYPEDIDGPYSYTEAVDWITNCKDNSEEYLLKYGTIYNLLPSPNKYLKIDGDKSFFPWLINYLLSYPMYFSPLFIFYFFKKRKNNNYNLNRLTEDILGEEN